MIKRNLTLNLVLFDLIYLEEEMFSRIIQKGKIKIILLKREPFFYFHVVFIF
jgi:hypothetical protein